ncbi:iduronate 2-sulfatase-like isoform X2 [Patiria miniata]|uniref:Sulfatase N-terminal domain-containing protein n=1 Tax=Patiria miniata TaxID=46514 RepID=A0A913ZVG9_PATMI|nr:iduronate 2-sulfatase-like isoform X2 [Patiria miniata]
MEGLWFLLFATFMNFGLVQNKDFYLSERGGVDRRNVLFLVVDDLAPVISSYGGRALTPNIDQLAAQSVRFTNAYAQQPLCAPSRVSFLTSRRPDTTKTYNNKGSYWRTNAGNFTTLPQYFRDAGYFTASIGKIFHNAPVCGKDNDFPYSWSVRPYHAPTEPYGYEKVCPGSDGRLHFNLLCPVNVSTQPLGSLPDIQTTDHILEIFKSLSESRQEASAPHLPFFLGMGFHKPHISFRYPKEYLELYPLESVDKAPNAFYSQTQPPVAWNPFMDVRRREDTTALHLPFPYGPMPDKYHYLIRQAYYASTTYMDYELGRVLAGLEAAGFADDTIISFISDHGWQLGEHQEWSKFSNYATATRIPFMIHVPGITDTVKEGSKKPKFPLRDPFLEYKSTSRVKGKSNATGSQGVLVSDALVELTDLFPTLTDLVQLPVPPLCPVNSSQVDTCVEGVSLVPVIIDTALNHSSRSSKSWKKAAFTQYPRPSDTPRPDSDQPSLANITIMGYSMITADGYHYTEWVGFNNVTCEMNWSDVHARELYILHSDPLEDTNVADVKKNERLVQRLSSELHKGWRYALPKQV